MSTAQLGPVSGPDTICACSHWFEEHESSGACVAPGCSCQGYVFDPEENTPEAIADRGGDPEVWPSWLRLRLINELTTKRGEAPIKLEDLPFYVLIFDDATGELTDYELF